MESWTNIWDWVAHDFNSSENISQSKTCKLNQYFRYGNLVPRSLNGSSFWLSYKALVVLPKVMWWRRLKPRAMNWWFWSFKRTSGLFVKKKDLWAHFSSAWLIVCDILWDSIHIMRVESLCLDCTWQLLSSLIHDSNSSIL